MPCSTSRLCKATMAPPSPRSSGRLIDMRSDTVTKPTDAMRQSASQVSTLFVVTQYQLLYTRAPSDQLNGLPGRGRRRCLRRRPVSESSAAVCSKAHGQGGFHFGPHWNHGKSQCSLSTLPREGHRGDPLLLLQANVSSFEFKDARLLMLMLCSACTVMP